MVTRAYVHRLSGQRSLLAAACLLGVGFGVFGCGLQARIIQARHWDLNGTIRDTHSEQLLLNLARLRYDETPFFLQIASISTQFTAQASVGASAAFNENTKPTTPARNTYGLDAGASYSESPVVTWSLPDSSEYYGKILAPMSADQLTSLANCGYDPSLVFRVGIKKMNGLRNKEIRFKGGIIVPESNADFMEALRLIDELTAEGMIDLAYSVKSSVGAGKFPMDKLDIRAIPDGLEYGLQFMTRDDPNVFESLKLFKPLFLRFSKQSDNDPRAQRLRELLSLDSTKYSFGLVDTANSGTEQLRSEAGKISQVFDPDVKLAEIVLNNRSLMEVLYFASTLVQVPEADLAQGRARSDPDRLEQDWLKVLNSPTEPSDAWIKIKYRGYWFYIAEDDLNSRAAFTLLDAMFSSVVGNVPGGKPLLTLPVK